MVSSLVLRRTKEELAERQELTLTQRRVKSHMISLRQEERDIYQVIFTEARYIAFSCTNTSIINTLASIRST